MNIYRNFDELQGALRDFIYSNSVSDIRKSSPEIILNFYIASQRILRECVTYCKKELGLTSYGLNKIPIIVEPQRAKWFGLNGETIYIRWINLFKAKEEFFEVIVHELTHYIFSGHADNFWRLHYMHCQCLGLTQSDIPYDLGIVKKGRRSFLRHLWSEWTCFNANNLKYKALTHHRVFTSKNNDFKLFDERYYKIKWEYADLVYQLCKIYQIDFDTIEFSRKSDEIETYQFPKIEETWQSSQLSFTFRLNTFKLDSEYQQHIRDLEIEKFHGC